MPTPPHRTQDEPDDQHRSHEELHPHSPHHVAATLPPTAPPTPAHHVSRRRLAKGLVLTVAALLLLAVAGWFIASYRIRSEARAALPQLDGSLQVTGLAAPVTVARDARGVPTIHAQTIDDLVFAQAFITTGDRLFQMDMLRRHAAGELAEVYGPNLLPHDKLQRTLQIRAAADRAIAVLPPDQLHLLTVYARGVNSSIEQQSAHLPVEFHLLGYEPAPWTPRDSLLVGLAMFQDLTSTYPGKLARESMEQRLPPGLIADLYPVGSWRAHPPPNPIPHPTPQGPEIEQVPLDESQSKLHLPATPGGSMGHQPTETSLSGRSMGHQPHETRSRNQGALAPAPLAAQIQPAEPWAPRPDPSFTPGSNNWVVSGAHTASGKPLLANDMHLTHTLPGIWYETALQADEGNLQVAGVTIPGLPLIVVGHNGHIAWGFTNLGADVQDVYIETLRGSGDNQQFQAADGSWQPVLHIAEKIKVKHALNTTLELLATRHGDTVTPILTPVLANETRPLALRWPLYDPTVLELPSLAIAQAHDWPSFLAAFSKFGGPAQNAVYADDAGHIGYHAVGRIPLRGPAEQVANSAAAGLPTDIASPVDPTSATTSASTSAPIKRDDRNPLAGTDLQNPATHAQALLSGPLSPLPLVPSPAHEWTGYIPFDQLPQVFDPPSGIVATANARVTPDDYPYPIALNWAAPYRAERIVHALAHRTGLKPEDMLDLQNDVYSDFDHVLAERLAYSLDRSAALGTAAYTAGQQKSLRQAADLLRTWNGRMTLDSPASAIVYAVHAELWPMLLEPHIKAPGATSFSGATPQPGAVSAATLNSLYTWGERDYALEQILAHNPPRWLPPTYTNWDDFLTAVVNRALVDAKAPADLTTWKYGTAFSTTGGEAHTVDIEHPIFGQSALLRRLLGAPTGTGPQPQSGDGTTVKQVGHAFGPSERFTADLGNLQHSTLNIVSGQSGDPLSPWFLDQFPTWLRGTTFPQHAPATHTLTFTP